MGASSTQWEPGRLVGDHYRVDTFLDEGSAGEVYAGQNIWTGRGVALKRLQPHHRDHPIVVERFLLEGRIGGRIDHPNIVQTLDMARETSDESFFLVQELLQGVALRTLLLQSPKLHYRDALDLVIPLLGALIAVHQQGIVHRDIKPENIFVADSCMGHRVPKLLDFGIAKVRLAQTLTQAGSLIGTVDYMAPEQIEGRKDVDRRVDVWALGVLTYELLSGCCPFSGSNPAATLSRIISHDPPSVHELVPDVPRAVSSTIERAMRKDRQERHDSVQQLLEDLLCWSLTTHDDLDRAIMSRHRTSLPSTMDQKLRTGVVTMAPSSMRTSLMVTSHRSGQFQFPENLRELAAFMNGEDGEQGKCDDVTAPVSPEVPYQNDAVSSEMGTWRAAPDSIEEVPDVEEMIARAYSCLRNHAFTEAYDAAERAQAGLRDEPRRKSKLFLLQAETAYWSGKYDVHEACVIEALALTHQYDCDWFRCIAELAESSSLFGLHNRLSDLVQELAHAVIEDETTPDYVIASCRLGIALQRAGWPEQVETVMGRLRSEMFELADRNPVVQAWICLLRSELATYAGDHGHGLDLTHQALSAFQRSGDVRRACICRGNVGSGAMRLGNHEIAEDLLRASFEEASSIRLAGAVTMRLHLGITLARLGRIAEGQECVARALRVYIRRGDWAGECAARIYLSEIAWMQGNSEGAEREAQAAVDRAHVSPVIQAEALGMLSMVLLARPMEAFMAASQAMELLQSFGGLAEGEARIRLAYALALDALGHADAAASAYVQGRDRLFERASRISNSSWRKSFLEGVSENSRTIHLAESRGMMPLEHRSS